MTTNARVRNILDKQLVAKRLSHAYLFVGPKGVGKKNMALEFARKVIGDENLEKHPDFSEFDCQEDASAESVREFIGRMALKPFVAKKKFALIANIENLNTQGANALLKTLEEPAENTVIVLTANTRRVLPTILSRCQIFSFNRGSTRGSEKTRIYAQIPKAEEQTGSSILDFAGKTLAEKLLAIHRFAEMEEADLEQEIENFIYGSANQLFIFPERYHHLAAGLKAYEDLSTNKNKKLILQGLMMRV